MRKGNVNHLKLTAGVDVFNERQDEFRCGKKDGLSSRLYRDVTRCKKAFPGDGA